MKAQDLKGKTVGTVGGGRIAYEVMKRLAVGVLFAAMRSSHVFFMKLLSL